MPVGLWLWANLEDSSYCGLGLGSLLPSLGVLTVLSPSMGLSIFIRAKAGMFWRGIHTPWGRYSAELATTRLCSPWPSISAMETFVRSKLRETEPQVSHLLAPGIGLVTIYESGGRMVRGMGNSDWGQSHLWSAHAQNLQPFMARKWGISVSEENFSFLR